MLIFSTQIFHIFVGANSLILPRTSGGKGGALCILPKMDKIPKGADGTTFCPPAPFAREDFYAPRPDSVRIRVLHPGCVLYILDVFFTF